MKRAKRSVVLACIMGVVWCGHSARGAERIDVGSGHISLEPSFGIASVAATELVFDNDVRPGYKLSQLDWSANVILFGLSGEWRGDRFSLCAGIWRSLASLGGEMTDSDWSDAGIADWTDRTEHDAEVDVAIIDLSAGFGVLRRDSFAMDLMVGFCSDTVSWSDTGGSGVHTERSFRDTPVEFEDTGIEYEQAMSIPYIGLRFDAAISDTVTLVGYVKYSTFGEVSAEDIHYGGEDGDTLYSDSFSDVEYIAVGGNCAWRIHDRAVFRLGLHMQSVPQVKGESKTDGDDAVYESGAGTEGEMLMATVGYLWQF